MKRQQLLLQLPILVHIATTTTTIKYKINKSNNTKAKNTNQ